MSCIIVKLEQKQAQNRNLLSIIQRFIYGLLQERSEGRTVCLIRKKKRAIRTKQFLDRLVMPDLHLSIQVTWKQQQSLHILLTTAVVEEAAVCCHGDLDSEIIHQEFFCVSNSESSLNSPSISMVRPSHGRISLCTAYDIQFTTCRDRKRLKDTFKLVCFVFLYSIPKADNS